MGLTGKEVMLVLVLFGIFLGIKKLRTFIYTHPGNTPKSFNVRSRYWFLLNYYLSPPINFLFLGIAYASTLFGINAYLVNELNARSIILGLGVATGLIVQWAMLWSPNAARRDRAGTSLILFCWSATNLLSSVYAHMLGLLCLISGRFALCTINPIYYLKETNIAALVLGLLSSFIFSKDSSAQEQAGMIFIHDINTFVLYIYMVLILIY